MSACSSAWSELYAAQTNFVGAAITATVAGLATSKPCIPSEAPFDRENAPDGGGETWGQDRTLQMLASDLSATPTRGLAVTVSDDARAMELLDCNLNNGIWYLRIGQLASES